MMNNWLIRTFSSSIGKKLMMALTGLGFCGFLKVHLIGNLFLYGGKDAFNSYAEHLHSLGPLVNVAEFGLLTLAVIHISTGLILFFQNYQSRPVRYAVKKSGGGRTIGSMSMPYTGIVMLLFILFHLVGFHFADKSTRTIFDIVHATFSNPAYVVLYVAAMAVVAIHVSHGLWSAFQTIGANHPKYMPLIMLLSVIFSIVVGVGFGFIPLYMLMIS